MQVRKDPDFRKSVKDEMLHKMEPENKRYAKQFHKMELENKDFQIFMKVV